MMMLPFKVARIQSLFAADLFLSFLLFKREGEVPEVNKPRRACLYFSSIFNQRSFFYWCI